MDQSEVNLTEGIRKTVAFFDGLSHALTDFEIWQYGFFNRAQSSFQDVQSVIHRCIAEGTLERVGAFVVLPKREELARERIKRSMLTEKKYRKVRAAISILRLIPFLRMVGVCNTLAFDSARSEGDIDVFIVAKRNRLYTTYAIATLLFHVFGLRRHKLRIQNKICLSFYVSEDGMDMSRFELHEGDPYLAQWTRSVIPMFTVGSTAEAYRETNAIWLSKYFGSASFVDPVSRFRVQDTLWSRLCRTAFEVMLFPVGPLVEHVVQLIERMRFRHSSARRLRNEPTGVVVDHRTLKFHEEDRRAFYRDYMQSHV